MTERDFRGETKVGRAMIEMLATLGYEDLIAALGPPDLVTTTFRDGGRGWQQGDSRPNLASDDVAVVQAMARCLTWRAIHASPTLALGAGLNLGAIHPRVCNWCEYPFPELEAAVSWAGWSSMLVEIEFATWHGIFGSHYDRVTPRQGTYQNPRWAAWFRNDPDRETAGRIRTRAIERAMYGQDESTR